MLEQLPKQYLGDGVYAEFDGYQIRLTVDPATTQNGQLQEIFLDPLVFQTLHNFAKQWGLV